MLGWALNLDMAGTEAVVTIILEYMRASTDINQTVRVETDINQTVRSETES